MEPSLTNLFTSSMEDEVIENLPTDTFTPREYQVELFEASLEENTIVCLGTGTGKTFIAVMMIKELEHEVRIPFEDGGKRTFFLVPSVPLVVQQKSAIQRHTSLKIGGYIGAMGVDNWDKQRWLQEFSKMHVLVMTADIFKIIITHGFLAFSCVNLIIVDECHKAVKKHTYRQIFRCLDVVDLDKRPRVLGLTASVINSKVKEAQVVTKIKDLEKALHCRVLTASDRAAMSRYGTKPTEIVVLYRYSNTILDVGCTSIEKCVTDEQRELERQLNDICHVVKELGPWCGKLACDLFIDQVSRECEKLDDAEARRDVLDCLSKLQTIRQKLADVLALESDEQRRLLRFATPKLHKLLEILRCFKPLGATSDCGNTAKSKEPCEELCGIVFVQERTTARVLKKWLSRVAKSCPEYDFVRPQSIVGHGGSLQRGLREAGMSFTKQCKVLAGFRRHMYNLLVATAVVEEGMDVPSCNLVVRFDFPADFRSYVQSKGRARARRSLYVMMVGQEDRESSTINLANYVSIEQDLLKKCHGRKVPHNAEIETSYLADELKPPYMPVRKDGAARVTMTSAISLVNRYCGKLPSDIFTLLTPTYSITGSTGHFVCTIYLPMTSPLKEPIVGDSMETKKAAKMSAALETCKRLHEIGELDDNLLPVKHVVDFLDELEEDETEGVPAGTPKPGTKKRRRLYRKRVCRLFRNARADVAGTYHLHVLTTRIVRLPSAVQNWRKEKLLDPEDSQLWFGILLKEEMPMLPSFPIFTRSGEEEMSVFYAGIVRLNEEQCAAAQSFHRALFDDVLRMANRKLLTFDFQNAPNRVTVVPVVMEDSCTMIDWSFVEMTLQRRSKNDEKFVFRKIDYEGAVVVPHYRPPTYRYNSFYVRKVRQDLCPDSEVHEGRGTLRDFLSHVHGLEVTEANQPLLEVSFTEFRLNFLTPRFANRKGDTFAKKNVPDGRIELRAPEFCDVHPFRALVWHKAVCLPSILYRLNQLLVAEELRVTVTEGIGVGTDVAADGGRTWPTLDFQCVVPGNSTLERRESNVEVAFGNILRDHGSVDEVRMPRISRSFEYQPKLEGNPGPSPGLLLEALTWAKATDGFDLERLEVLGDSFLKFVVTIDLFCSQTTAHEGLLTEARARIISNRNLHRLGCGIGIGECAASMVFEPNRNWLPPGYVMPEDAENALLDGRFVCWMLQENPRKLETVTAKELLAAYEVYKTETSSPDFTIASKEASGPVPACLTSQLGDKGIADSVEAIIGAYLLVCGPLGAIKLMKWLGLKLSQCDIESAVASYGTRDDSAGCPSFLGFAPPVTALLDYVPNPQEQLASETARHAGVVHDVESALGYTFRDRSFLLQAVTHASYYKNRLTDCYQRLEFLGDAVIDYLVTRYVYEGPRKFSPGQLTDLRSALVNNCFFASLIVRYGLHKCFKHCNPGLFSAIGRFVEYRALSLDTENESKMESNEDELLDLNKENSVPEMVKQPVFESHYIEEGECQEQEEVEVPKALGDLFESLVGAVFLDCGMSLDRVWHVLYRMFGCEIECFTNNVPVPPVRELMETFPDAHFSGAEILRSGKVKVEVTVRDRTFSAVAKSKKLAKTALAKKCLRAMKGPSSDGGSP